MRRFLLLAVGVALSATLTAQTRPTPSPSPAAKPDFSGTWEFASGSDGRGGNPTGFNLGQQFTVTQDAKTLTVVSSPGPGGPLKYVYQLDGSVSQNTIYQNTVDTAKVEWQGSKLVITTVGSMSRTQTWTLDAATSRLVVETSIDIPGSALGPIVTTATYYRK